MLVGFNNLGFSHLQESKRYVGVEGFVQAAHDLGFRAFQWTTSGEKNPEFFKSIDADSLRGKLESLGVVIYMHDHAIDLLSLHHFAERDEYYDNFIAYLSAAAEFLRSVGGDLITFHPPQVNVHRWTDGAFDDLETVEKATRAFEDTVRRLGEVAQHTGVRMAFEAICFEQPFIGGTSFRKLEQLDEFLALPDFPEMIGVQIDTTHYHHKGKNVCDIIRRWQHKLMDMHVSDSVVHEWKGPENYKEKMLQEVHLPIGQGTTDFAAVTRTLKDVGYDQRLSLELYPQNVRSVDEIVQARETLEKLWTGRQFTV